MILKTIVVLALIVVAILIFATTRPSTFRIQRSVNIQAPPEKVFALINNLHNWPSWAPQDVDDPTIKRTFSGADSGVGAISDWSGSGSTGAGQMRISESVPLRSVVVQVDFEKPFVAHNVNEFTLEPDGSGSKVTWSMHGPNLYIMKLMSVFTSMDRMMGQHFEEGLANLKKAAEK